MGVTYSTAGDRDRRRGTWRAGLQPGELALIVTGVVSALAIMLAYGGRMAALDAVERGRGGGATVDLTQVTSAEALEAVTSLAFENTADRRLAARELLSRVLAERDGGSIPNVGVITRYAVPRTVIARTPRLEVYAARAAADSAGDAVPLFTSADLAALKPALVVRTAEQFTRTVFWSALLMLAAFQVASLVWRIRGVPADRVLVAAAHVLVTLGFLVVLSRPDPLRDAMLIERYAHGVVIAVAFCLAVSFVNMRTAAFLELSYLPLAVALLTAAALVFFGTGPGTSGARINLGPVQPSEGVRLLVAFFLAGYFARRWELIRDVRGRVIAGRTLPGWLDLPRVDHVLPVIIGVGVSLALFFVQRDLGPALLLSVLFLTMVAVARGGPGLAAIGVALLGAGIFVGHLLGVSSTLSARVAMWQQPWDNAVRGGDQVAQAAWSLASGGPWGAGLGLGAARYVPAGHTDLAMASLGEELGMIGLLVLAGSFAIITWKGLRVARRASTDYGCFLAVAMSLTVAVPAIVMAAGILGLLPLTGLVTPFVSYGGSAMVVNFTALGLLLAVGRDQRQDAPTAPFQVPLVWLGRTLAGVALLLIAVWGRAQVVQADELIVRPQLSRQADGGVRYQYNPRVLEAARLIPRGTVFDRRAVPLATDDPKVLETAKDELARLNISTRDTCPRPDARCYPLGDVAFHLLGNATTRLNWAASNSSYVERDAEDDLRGFDDRATAVRTDDAPGSASVALRRDYRDLVPLVRHRWEPNHADVRALLDRRRDVRLTIDASLQQQAAAILARAAQAAGVEHAAAVMLDAATGEVLASVSYPWPHASAMPLTGTNGGVALLDRARYGLYPPGSTFKLVTAAAALRQDVNLRGLSFTCARLPGNRIGARVPGFAQPVRDDVLDRHPHGAVTMRQGLVQSCNAYFAQLAVRIGERAMVETANRAGVSVAPPGAPERIRATLAHAAYGQGDVVATPMRMARVAAAIASDGTLREPSLIAGAAAPPATSLLSPDAARLLAGFMREAVTSGTGRQLAVHPARIAGKTGTAEVDDAASHAWFVGFAPHGSATRRVAFAVILEHAGYGGNRAALVAGQLVTAAASLGHVR